MLTTRCYQSPGPKQQLEPSTVQRRKALPTDVGITIKFAGICHSDLHQLWEDWGPAKFPMVPGHEIVGQAYWVGPEVPNVNKGDWVGVGCMVDACLDCEMCHAGSENYCSKRVYRLYFSFLG